MVFEKMMCWFFMWPFLIISFECVFSQLQDIDNRCFLNGGGSTLSFFVKESLPISSVIGRLDIQGDVEKDIELILGKSFRNYYKMSFEEICAKSKYVC